MTTIEFAVPTARIINANQRSHCRLRRHHVGDDHEPF